MSKEIDDLQTEAINMAAEHIRTQRKRFQNVRFITACITVLLVVAMICCTVLCFHAISEQQEIIRAQQLVIASQYDQLTGLLSGAEIVTEEYVNEADSEDGGTAIAGNGNTDAGGDLIGEGEE